MTQDNDGEMMCECDVFTSEDRASFRDLHYREEPRTVRVVAEVNDGTIVEGHEKREVFTFTEPSIGSFVFDVGSIKRAIADDRIVGQMLRLEPIPENFYQHVRANNGVEVERLMRITARDLKRPGIMVDWGNGYQTMIDGNHRMCQRYNMGLKSFRFVLVDVIDCAPHMCRPGDEEKLFAGARDPDAEVLHVEIRTED